MKGLLRSAAAAITTFFTGQQLKDDHAKFTMPQSGYRPTGRSPGCNAKRRWKRNRRTRGGRS